MCHDVEEQALEPNKKKLRDEYKSKASVGGVYRITCSENGMTWTRGTVDLRGAKNRFEFACKTNLSPEMALNEVWKTYGSKAFALETLEEIEQGETQSQKEFSKDVAALLAMVIGKEGTHAK